MWCSRCQHDNDVGAVYCSYCGTELVQQPIPAGNKPNTGSTIDLGRNRAAPVAPPQPNQSVLWQSVQTPPSPPLVVPPAPHVQQSHGHQGWWWFLAIMFIVFVGFKVVMGVLGALLLLVFRFWWLGLLLFWIFGNRRGHRHRRHWHHRRTWHH